MGRDENIAEKLRKKFVENASVLHGRYEKAFKKVPRHKFVPDNFSLEEIYSNKALVIEEGGIRVTSSTQPFLMAHMLALLSVNHGHKVLEIGTGTGYNAALLAEIVGNEGNIYTVEINETLAEKAKKNLSQYANIHVITGDGSKGYVLGAPYDRIIVTAKTTEFIPYWLEQLDEGGILVAPFAILGREVYRDRLVRIERQSDRFIGKFSGWVSFIPMIGEYQELFDNKQAPKPLNELIQFLSKRWNTLANNIDIFIFCKICEAIQSNLFGSEDLFKGDENLIHSWLDEINNEWLNTGSPTISEYKIELFPNEKKIEKSEKRFVLERKYCKIVIDY